MAMERDEIPVTPEVTMSCGVELRRHSTGKASSGNGEEKVVPHYLRASTGSCHDFCKYGRKHAFETKGRSSVPKRVERKQLHQSSEEGVGGIMISVARPRASLDSKPTKMSVIKHEELVDSELQISYATGRKSSGSQKQIGNKVLISRSKSSLVKTSPSLLPNSHLSSFPKTRRQEFSSTFKVETSSKSTSKKEETPLKLNFERAKTRSQSASKKMGASSKKSSLKSKVMELSDKHVISMNSNSVAEPKVASTNSSDDFGGKRSSEIKMEKRESSFKVAPPVRAAFSSAKPSIIKRIASTNARKHKSLEIVSHLRNQPKPRKDEPKEHNNEIEEKTLYVIKVENESQTLQSDQNASQEIESSLSHSLSPHKFTSSSISQSSSQEGQEESEYATSEFEEDSYSRNHDESEYIENEKTLKGEENDKAEKDVNVCCEDKACQMLKLKIIGRKLVESQIEKRNSPRRLKFRRGKVLWNNAADATEKVVLRHHDVKSKKDGQVLLNNVIEETASKLVETQKSKVKALVGAFESIISLHEQKPFANIVN